MRVGRRRTKKPGLPAGVREIGATWYWQPTSKRERDERRTRGEAIGCTLGPAGSKAARIKWAEVSGYRDPAIVDGTVAELLDLFKRDGLKKRPNGQPRAESTIESYTEDAASLQERFGACRYGKTEHEASRGTAIGAAEIQRWVSEHPSPGLANRQFAVLDNAFSHGIRVGRTTYNPCSEVVKNYMAAREREAMPWEVECLSTLAKPRLGLQMDFEAITGWRISDILGLLRSQGTADGVKVRYAKRGKRHLWEWTPELRRIWSEAAALPYATPFPASPVFPSRKGKVLSYASFDYQWQTLKAKVNAALSVGIVDPSTLSAHAALRIEDLHFHDLRAKAHDDAEDAGQAGHSFLGNTKQVADKHYARREQKRRPLR